jgi:hypothetical protein
LWGWNFSQIPGFGLSLGETQDVGGSRVVPVICLLFGSDSVGITLEGNGRHPRNTQAFLCIKLTGERQKSHVEFSPTIFNVSAFPVTFARPLHRTALPPLGEMRVAESEGARFHPSQLSQQKPEGEASPK